MDTILVILGLLVASALVYYFGFYKKGKINDADGDFIPDEIEEAVEEVKDVVEELKDVVDQAKDITDAVKGKPRRGRKAKK